MKASEKTYTINNNIHYLWCFWQSFDSLWYLGLVMIGQFPTGSYWITVPTAKAWTSSASTSTTSPAAQKGADGIDRSQIPLIDRDTRHFSIRFSIHKSHQVTLNQRHNTIRMWHWPNSVSVFFTSPASKAQITLQACYLLFQTFLHRDFSFEYSKRL